MVDSSVANTSWILAPWVVVASVVILILTLALCVCKQRKKGSSLNEGKYTPGDSSTLEKTENGQANSVSINASTGIVPVSGHPPPEEQQRSSTGSQQKSPGHSPHHGTQRKLPAPPENVANGLSSSNHATRPLTSPPVDEDDYDHLNTDKQKAAKRRSNYDHVVIRDDGSVDVESRKDTDYVLGENIYTPVKETSPGHSFDDYSEVNDIKSRKSASLSAEVSSPAKMFPKLEDPYATLGEEREVSNGSVAVLKESREHEEPFFKAKDKFDPYSQVADKFDPYSKVKDKFDPYSKVKDPYNRVKDIDDPYNRLKEPFDEESATGSFDDFDPYNKVKDDDPYNRVIDSDPYNKMKETDPYNKIKGDEFDDPYNKIKGEDPYDDFVDIMDDPKDDYATVDPNRKDKAEKQVTTITVTSNGKTEKFSYEEGSHEYAVVMKQKQETTPAPPVKQPNATTDRDSMALPPEPPRNYRGETNVSPRASLLGVTGHVSPNTTNSSNVDSLQEIQNAEISEVPESMAVQESLPSTNLASGNDIAMNDTGARDQSNQTPIASNAQTTANHQSQLTEADGRSRKREPPYIKLTSRESIASINARRLQNTYEVVPETENMYATVEGGSGDGVVRRQQDPGATNGANNRFYSEIDGPPATEHESKVPVPPSLDSLHLTAKAHSENRKSSRSSREENSLKQEVSTNSVFSGPSSPVPASSSVAKCHNNSVVVDPDYTMVKDCIPDVEIEADPNYESVEDAKAKVRTFEIKSEATNSVPLSSKAKPKSKRDHVYEEVKPTSEAMIVKNRVLRSHMYEDIDAVQEQKRELDKKSHDSSVIKNSKKK